MVVLAVVVVMLTTVVPWLIFKMFEQGASDLRRLKAKRVNAVVPKLLDDVVPRSRIPLNRSPRIRK